MEGHDAEVDDEDEAVPDEGRGGAAELVVEGRDHVRAEQKAEEDERQDVGDPKPEHTEGEPARVSTGEGRTGSSARGHRTYQLDVAKIPSVLRKNVISEATE